MIKKVILSLAFVISAIIPFGFVEDAHAVDARKCISFITHPNSIGIKNSCNSDVLFVYCDRKPCRGNGVIPYYGYHQVVWAGRTQNLFSNRNNMRNIQWAACTVPRKGNDWAQITITNNNGGYSCSNYGNSSINSNGNININTASELTSSQYESLSKSQQTKWMTKRKGENSYKHCMRTQIAEFSLKDCTCRGWANNTSTAHCF